MTNNREYPAEQYRAWAEFHGAAQAIGRTMLRDDIPFGGIGQDVTAANLGRVVVFTGGRRDGQGN